MSPDISLKLNIAMQCAHLYKLHLRRRASTEKHDLNYSSVVFFAKKHAEGCTVAACWPIAQHADHSLAMKAMLGDQGTYK